jgi:hypothetical protein
MKSTFTRLKRLLVAVSVFALYAQYAWAAISIDAVVSKDQAQTSTIIASPSFSTRAGNELLLAFVSTDNLSGTNTTVTGVTGGGLTWTLVRRTNVQRGTAEIWRAFAPGTLASVSVTAALSQKVGASLTVATFTGVDTSGTGGAAAIGATAGANANPGAPSATLTTTRDGSWTFGVGNDWDTATSRSPGLDQSLVHQYLAKSGDTFWVQRQNATTPTAGTSVMINDTAPTTDRYNLAIVEILPAPAAVASYSISGSITPATIAAGAVVTLSGTAAGTTMADANGHYSFANLANGAYTVTPAKSSVTFTPSSQSVTVNGANQTANFTATAVTHVVSGSITPSTVGASATVTMSEGGSTIATVSADSGGNYAFSTVTDGTYAIAPTKTGYAFTPASRSVTVAGADVSGVDFTGQSAPPLALDVTVSKDNTGAANSITSPPISTVAGGELLLALVATDSLAPNMTVTGVSGGGLTWTLVVRTNAQGGTSEIWRAFSPSTLTNATITAQLSQSVLSSMTVISFTGVDQANPIGASGSGNARSGAPTATLATTHDNAWVVGVGNDYANAIARSVPSNQVLIHQNLSATGDTYWMQRMGTATPVRGTSVTINDTAPTADSYNLSIVEVVGAGSAAGDTSPPVVAVAAPAASGTAVGLTSLAANASDNVAVAGVQFSIDGAPIGSELTSAPYYTTWNSTTVSNGAHTLTVRARDGSGNASTASVAINVDNSGNPAVVGSWSQPVTLPAVAVNLLLLKNNKLFFYQDGASATVWDYVSNVFTSVPTSVNLFCSGHAFLADGRVLVVGGFGGSGSLFGIANAEIFDPATNAWTTVPNMSYRRWYPTATTLSDGRIIVTAGWQTTAHTNAGIPEIYDPSQNQWTKLTAANNPFETYPFIYLLPDGTLWHVGGTEYATDTDVLDVSTQSWTTIDSRIIDGSSPAMYVPGKIVKAGSAADSQFSGPSSNTTFVLDTALPNPVWHQAPSMAYARSFMNMTVLPDGSVLATGGESDKDGGNVANAVYAAELWSPVTQTWTTMASMHTPREYHSTALLLPDGRVVQSGMGADFGNVMDENSAEFYSPPYLFRGSRPTITQAPAQVHYATNFTVSTPDAGTINSVVLIRNGGVTHFFDENTRYVPLTFAAQAGQLQVTAPVDGRLAPPGYYMLFLVNSNGVPSIAPMVQVGP